MENQPIPTVRPEFDLTRRGLPGLIPGTERWLLSFYQRSFDLSEFRTAIYTDAPVATVNQIVAGLEQKMVADQAPFAAAITALGGRVSHQWWIVNGCAVEVPRWALVLIAAIPNVATMEPDRVSKLMSDPRVPNLGMIETSTNAANHNADALHARGFHGAGVAYAIVDSGQDSDMNGTGQPHITYFENGVKPGKNLLVNKKLGSQPADDQNGHGTGVCSIMGGNKWKGAHADFGHAHNAGKIGYSVCNTPGSCDSTQAIQMQAFKMIEADKATYKIVSANMSMSGNPDPTSMLEQAIDSCALNADVFIATAAGNTGDDTTTSPSNANGLCVAACQATFKTIISFSCRGFLSGDTVRYFPDITACGGYYTWMARRDDESADYPDSGTSLASPQVSGAAALLRSIHTGLTALETKAILLCSAEDISAKNLTAPYNSRNAYGMGFLRDDLAEEQARIHGAITSFITGPDRNFSMNVTKGRQYSVVLAWHRTNLMVRLWNNLNLRVLNGATEVAISATPRNLYEKVVFTAGATGRFTIEVSAGGPLNPNRQTFALCHNGDRDRAIMPAAAAAEMGNANNNIPFSSPPTRYQQVFSGPEVGPPASFTNLRLRQDEAFNSITGATVDLEIRLAETTLDEMTLTSTFATNLNSGSLIVVPRKNIVLPHFPPTNNSDAKEFFLIIPFAQPFPWPATAGRNLIVDVTQRGNSRGNANFVYPLDAHGGTGVTTTRLFSFPDNATTGVLDANYGLVMTLGTDNVTASYTAYGTGCPGTGPGIAHVILPAALAAAMGSSSNVIPFSWAPTRYQQVFLGSEQPVARSYTGLGLRQDDAVWANAVSNSVDLEMALGYTTFTNATLTSTFATNFNSGVPVTVFPRQVVALPDIPAVPNSNPSEFFIKFPFTTPFPYVPAAGRNTLIQLIQRIDTYSGNSGYRLDADSATTTTRLYGGDTALTGTLGVNYGLVMSFLYSGAAGAIPLLTHTGDPLIGNTFSVDVWQARPSSAAILFLGVSNTTWSSFPLPFSLAGVGAPACFIHASGDVLLTAATNAAGRSSYPFAIPADNSLLSGIFFNQYAVVDGPANALGLAFSNGGAGVMGTR